MRHASISEPDCPAFLGRTREDLSGKRLRPSFVSQKRSVRQRAKSDMELIAVDPQIEVVRIEPLIDIVLSRRTKYIQSIEAGRVRRTERQPGNVVEMVAVHRATPIEH